MKLKNALLQASIAAAFGAAAMSAQADWAVVTYTPTTLATEIFGTGSAETPRPKPC